MKKDKKNYMCAAYVRASAFAAEQQWFAGVAALPCNSNMKNVAVSEQMWHNGDLGAREESPDFT